MGTRLPLLLLLELVLIHHASEVMSAPRSCIAFCANGVDDRVRLLPVPGQGRENQFIYDANIFQNTIRTIKDARSAALCFGQCIRQRGCKGWSYFPSDHVLAGRRRTCLLKRAVPGFRFGQKVISGYNKARISCSQPKVRYLADGINVINVGVPLSNITSEHQAQMNCATTAQCKFYTWNPITRTSQNFRGSTTAANLGNILANGGTITNTARVSGTRTCPGGYNSYITNVDFKGKTLARTNVDDAKACRDLCNDDTNASCKFFVFHYKFVKQNCYLYANVGEYRRPGSYAVAGARCCCPAGACI